MPKITVRVPHQLEPAAAFEKLLPALEKTARDFQGRDLELTPEGTSAQFSFKSMAFTITGRAEATASEATVEVDLPFAALMFKDQAERAVTKNVTRALTDTSPPAA